MEKLTEAIQQALIELSDIFPQYGTEDEHNKDTARRIASTWIEMCKGYKGPDFLFTTFDNIHPQQPIILRDIPFVGFCAHHFLPFSGKVHIGYIPDKKICGISKLPRVVEYIASVPQIQESMTHEICDFIGEELLPFAAVVIVEAEHTCVACRGIKSQGSKMITKAMWAEATEEDKIAITEIEKMLSYGL